MIRLFTFQQFHNIAYKATGRKELLSAINEFLDDSIVLPPGDWERKALLPFAELKAKSEAIRKRKNRRLKEAEAEESQQKGNVIRARECRCPLLPLINRERMRSFFIYLFLFQLCWFRKMVRSHLTTIL